MKQMEKSFISRLFSPVDVGIDLGTSSLRIFLKNRGIVLREPSVAAVDRSTGKVGAIGSRALALEGKTGWDVVWPLQHGVIAEFDEAQGLLEAALGRVMGRNLFFKPRVMLCVPTGVTGVERRAVTEAATMAGAAKTYLAEEPVAAALGAGIHITEPRGHLVVNIGSGTTSAAVLSLGKIICAASLRQGGGAFNEIIVRHLQRTMNFGVTFAQAEALKQTLGTLNPLGQRGSQIVQGKDAITGLPTSLRLTGQDLAKALGEPLQDLVVCLRTLLEKTPPELCADILEEGIVLTGGGALLNGLADALAKQMRMRTVVASQPEDCVAIGAGMALEDSELLEIMTDKRG